MMRKADLLIRLLPSRGSTANSLVWNLSGAGKRMVNYDCFADRHVSDIQGDQIRDDRNQKHPSVLCHMQSSFDFLKAVRNLVILVFG